MGTPGWRRSSGGDPFISPNHASRLQERRDLADLNNRLAVYIDVVHNLLPDQTDHQNLIQEITEDLRRTYEAKLADAHAEREQEARGRAQLQVELNNIRDEYTELGDSNNRKKAELDDALTRQRELEALLNTKDAALNTAVGEKRALEADMRNLKDDLTKLNDNFSLIKTKLQEETLRKLEAENSLQTLNDKLKFQMNSHAEEKKNSQKRYDELLAKSNQSGQGFEGKLAIADLRAQFEEQFNFYKVDSEKNYESKLEVIKRELERTKQQVKDHTVERQENRDKIKGLSTQVIDQQTQIRDLERKLAREQDLKNEKEQEMARVQAELQQKVDECRNLHVIDGDLGMELETYRSMLEGEERRLKLSPSPTRPQRRTPRSDLSTTSRRLFSQTPSPRGRGGKRTQPCTSSPGTQGSQGSPVKKIKITQKASARGPIKVDEVDMNGKFVQLKNMSDNDQPLTNWCLKGQVGNSAPSVYKFPRGFILKAEQTVTIWAASAGTTQNPPTYLVHEGLETWGTGDHQFSLINAVGEEIARRGMTYTEQFDDDEDDDDDRVSNISDRSIERTYSLRSRTVTSERDHSNQSSTAKSRAREQP